MVERSTATRQGRVRAQRVRRTRLELLRQRKAQQQQRRLPTPSQGRVVKPPRGVPPPTPIVSFTTLQPNSISVLSGSTTQIREFNKRQDNSLLKPKRDELNAATNALADIRRQIRGAQTKAERDSLRVLSSP